MLPPVTENTVIAAKEELVHDERDSQTTEQKIFLKLCKSHPEIKISSIRSGRHIGR